MRVEMEITGATDLTAVLEGVGERLDQPLTPLLNLVADVWQTDFQRNFTERQGTVDGGAWAELAPMTKSLRKWKGFTPDRPILQRTNDLFHSIGKQEETEDSVSVGTKLRYAAILQDGGVETYPTDVPGSREIPARPFIELHAELIEDVDTMVADFFFPSDSSQGAPGA